MSDTDKSALIRDARPDPAGGIAREQRRNRLAQLMFGVEQNEPLRFGRFVVLEHLGEGGMGTVHSAYDPQLDRRVALKLLRSGMGLADGARARMAREAQALARLSHPNVVPVHEFGVIDDQVFIVMEFVVGQTLRTWLLETTRDWREVLQVYLQAGAGLAAAHAMNVVHRDFKPDNVIRGDDGRVRVLDFGLARGYGSDGGDAEPSSVVDADVPSDAALALLDTDLAAQSGDDLARGENLPDRQSLDTDPAALQSNPRALAEPLTVTGAIMGTPAYMAPEQFIGADVGPKADQFSFCASLYEGLYGRRPFAGKDVDEQRKNVLAGRLREPRKGGVPRWLTPVLERGLQRHPKDRFPSMADLLAELARDRARARNRWLLAVAFLGLTAATVWALARSPDTAADSCEGASDKLAMLWNAQRQSSLETSLRDTGRAYADEVWPRVSAGLDRYRDDWVSMHTAACLAHRRGEQSGELLDRRMACLARRRSAFSGAVQVLGEIRADNLARAIDVVEGLPSIDYCGNVEALTAEVAPPEDAVLAGQVRGLRERLALVQNRENVGDYQEALAGVSAVVDEAEELAYRPLLAEALLVQGRVVMKMDRREDSVDSLYRAFLVGLETGMDRTALEALARYIYAEGTRSDSSVATMPFVHVGEAIAVRVPESAFGHALLLNNAGAVQLAREDRANALDLFERAWRMERLVRDGNDKLELTSILINLSIVAPHEELNDSLRPALERLDRTLGAAHPTTLGLRMIHSYSIASPAEAVRIRASVCDAYERFHADLLYPRAECLYSLGSLYAELGDTERAAEILASMHSLVPDDASPLIRHMARIAWATALRYRQQLDRAIAAYRAVITELRPLASAWWYERILVDALLGLGRSLLTTGDHEQAAIYLDEARASAERVASMNQSMDPRRRRAEAQIFLAMALARGAQVERVEPLLEAAEAWYRSAGAGYRWRLQELETWRQERGQER